jgi:hypothetical protein
MAVAARFDARGVFAVGGCELGDMIHDYALGKNGIVVDTAWTEIYSTNGLDADRATDWEWLVLYDDGELMGADTNDLQVIS